MVRTLKITFLLSFTAISSFAQFLDYKNFYIDHSQDKIDALYQGSFMKGTGLNILWWNILEGGNRAQSGEVNYIIENIKAIHSSPRAPDVIILSEFLYENFCHFEDELASQYPFQTFESYKKDQYGFLILSKKEINIKKRYLLNWQSNTSNNKWSRICEEIKFCNYNFPRNIFILEYKKNHRTYNIAPVHLLQPWTFLNRKLREEGNQSLIRKVKITNEILYSKTNPLNVQISDLYQKLKSEKNLVIVGDFNTPYSILGVSGRLAKTMEQGFKRLYSSGYTYPTEYAKDIVKGMNLNMPKMQIDHVFYSKQNDLTFNYFSILPFSGSDHYPLFISLD